MKPKLKFSFLAGALLFCTCLSIALMPGCTSTRLEPGGAYAPVDTNGLASAEADFDLFAVDSAYSLAHDAAGAGFKFERDNRLGLWKVSPAIKHGLDEARAQVKVVNLNYAVARTAYLANPGPTNLATLQGILQKAQQITSAAQAVIANQGTPGTGPPATPAN